MVKYNNEYYKQLFFEVDANKDGGISFQELKNFFKAKQMELTDDKIRYLRRYFDHDYKGVLSMGDWIDLCHELFCDFVM